MWTEIAIPDAVLDCRAPFSFFFDLVGKFWKAPGNSRPLHRICTLARKQDVTFAVLESAATRPDVREEISELDKSFGGGGAAEAIALSFFANPAGPCDVKDLPNESLLAHAVLINYR